MINPRAVPYGVVLAAVMSGAHAQSSVVLYGMLDVGTSWVSRTATADSHMFKLNADAGSSSRFGVRGSEDLGGGLAAIFNLEAPLSPKNGAVTGGANSGGCNAVAGRCTAPAFWRRNAYVGLKGYFGELTLGRNYTGAMIRQAPTLNALPSGINTGLSSDLSAQGINNDYWNNNQVRYDSPKLGPIDFSVHVAAGEGLTGRNLGGNIRYSEGGFASAFSYQNDKGPNGKIMNWMILSAAYDFGGFRVNGALTRVDNNNQDLTNPEAGTGIVGYNDSQAWTIGTTYRPTAQLALGAQYWNIRDKVGVKTDNKQLVLNADYSLSKRTALYVMFSYVDTKDLPIQILWSNSDYALRNDDAYGIVTGIRHSF